MEKEFKKIRLISAAFVLLQLYRVLNISLGQFLFNGYRLPHEEWIYTCITVAVLLSVLMGRWLPAMALAAALIVPKFEMVLGGGSISTPLFVYFMFFLSMWSWLVKSRNLKEPDNYAEASIILNRMYFILLSSYGMLNLLSALKHLADPYWISGDAMEMIFTHPFWGRFFETFRQLRTVHPTVANPVMHVLTWSVLISQLLIIPLYLFKTGRKLLVVWFVFLLITLFICMRVVMLPHFTLLLFILVFYRTSPEEYGMQLFKAPADNRPLSRFMLAHFMLFGALTMLKAPVVSTATDKVFWFVREWDTRVWMNRRSAQMGFFQPVVLNADHLQGHRRFLLYRITKGEKTLVPMLGSKGERLSYWPDPLFTENQGLEMIYSNCMSHITAYDSFTYQNNPTPYKWKGKAIERLIILDYRMSGMNGKVLYEADLSERKHPHQNGKASWDFSEKGTGTVRYLCDGNRAEEITR